MDCGVKSGTMHTVDAAEKYQRQIYTYLPDEKPDRYYDGNVFIINDKEGIKVDNIEEFLKDFNSTDIKKEKETVQTTLF